MNYENFKEKVCKIAEDAGMAIMKIYNECEGIVVERKGDNSPLTIADKASNKVICEGLESLDIQFPIISEENKIVAYQERSKYEYYWLIDPLDGTKEFIKRNGEFTVNIALVYKTKVVMGVVYTPVTKEMYWAAEGHGAFYTINGETSKLNAPEFTMQDKGLKVVCSRSHMNDETKAFIEKLNSPELVSKGSSLKFLELAKGNAHLYPRIAPTMEWDTAAAQIVLEQAGGKVLQFGQDDAVVYNKENLLNPYFVAYANVK